MGDAAGPTSSHAEYVSTLDPGIALVRPPLAAPLHIVFDLLPTWS